MRISKIALACLGLLALPGCAGGIQQAYDDAARRSCRERLSPAEIDACMASVSRNSSERSAERRD